MTSQRLDDMFDKAARQFGSNGKTLNEDVLRLQEWLDTQPHLPKMLNAHALRNFLILNKCSIEVAKQKIDNYYTNRSKVPEIVYEMNPKLPYFKAFNDMVYLLQHPQQTDEMYKLTFFKVKGEILSDNYDPSNWTKKFATLQELQLRNDVMCGDVLVVDFKGFSLSVALRLTPTFLHKTVIWYERVLSSRLKAVHLINVPPFVISIISTVKSFLKPKLAERFQFHSEVETLKKFIPLNLLPTDFGGEGLSLQEIEDALEAKYLENQELFDRLDEIKVDESFRPEKLNDTFGFYGNFKNIDVD